MDDKGRLIRIVAAIMVGVVVGFIPGKAFYFVGVPLCFITGIALGWWEARR